MWGPTNSRRTNMALQFRTIDGSQNNPEDPSINQANTDFVRVAPANFADGFDAMQPGPNAREISNIVVANNPDTHLEVNGVALSGMMYAWGQFVDHDLDLEKSGTNTADISIPVPAGDALPADTVIPVTRVAIDPAYGCTGPSRYRHQHSNGLARRFAGLRFRSGHGSKPPHRRWTYEGFGRRQFAYRRHPTRTGLCCRRRAGSGKS